MSDITIKITDNSDEFIEILKSRIPVALEACGLQAERSAKLLCPVDTGRLRNSITHATKEQAVYIGTNVEYAASVETGHILPNGSYTAPKPYLKPAIENNKEKYKAIMERCLK